MRTIIFFFMILVADVTIAQTRVTAIRVTNPTRTVGNRTSLINSNALKCGEFLRGFKLGYKDGYCYNDSNCTPPAAPLNEIYIPNANSSGCSYQDGYTRGLRRGKQERKLGIVNMNLSSR